VDSYGTPDDERFIAVWHANTQQTGWNLQAVREPVAFEAMHARFKAVRSAGGRPARAAVTPSRKFVELYVDNHVGTWEFGANLTSARYQEMYDELSKSDDGRPALHPVCVQGSGNGSDRRLSAIFAESFDPQERTFHATGPSGVSEIDRAIEAYMRDHRIRGAALAITRGTRLVHARGYTYAESHYPKTKPTSLFRLASVSKVITAICLYQILEEQRRLPHPRLSLDTTLQSLLALKTPNGTEPKDARFGDITIRHLLEHTSYLGGGLFESVAAAKAFGKSLPATTDQIASYAASLELSDDPGKPPGSYNNTGYFMLSQIITDLRNTQTFEQAVRKHVLAPLGIEHTRRSRSLLAEQEAGEMRYHLSNLVLAGPGDDDVISLEYGRSVRSPERPMVPYQYGVDDYEVYDGAGGLSGAAPDLARIAAALSLRADNPMLSASTIDWMLARAADAGEFGGHGFDYVDVLDGKNHIYQGAKAGWLKGSESRFVFTTGGFSYVFLTNGNGQKGVKTGWLPGVRAAAEGRNWDGLDLFPEFGMASFGAPRVPAAAPNVAPRHSPEELLELIEYATRQEAQEKS
jgi:CubicO group peptidase (beta-lactamase class C family)